MKAKRVNEVFTAMDGRQRAAALVDGHSRPERASEAVRLVKSQGFEDLHLAYFKRQDLGGDGVWDVWQIEGPQMLWYFRGEPHVHCWVHIRDARA